MPIDLFISPGNSKMGSVPSLSLSLSTCQKDVPCRKSCYARRMTLTRPTVVATWERNEELWRTNRLSFNTQLHFFLQRSLSRYFRYFVAGDIPSQSFLNMMVDIAIGYPLIRFVAHTKTWKSWSAEEINNLPDNLIIRASLWDADEWNVPPAGLPLTAAWPKKKGMYQAPYPRKQQAVLCSGSCPECGYKCWSRDYDVTIPRR